MRCTSRFFRGAWLICFATLFAGCSGIDNGATIDPEAEMLAGTWQYLVTNAFEATFMNCTGDAVSLDGMTFAVASASGPVCAVANSFVVVEGGPQELAIMPHDVGCGDGSSASVTGNVTLSMGTFAGQWQSVSSGGITSTQQVVGTVNGQTLSITLSDWAFTGAFEGSCEVTPALTATAQVS